MIPPLGFYSNLHSSRAASSTAPSYLRQVESYARALYERHGNDLQNATIDNLLIELMEFAAGQSWSPFEQKAFTCQILDCIFRDLFISCDGGTAIDRQAMRLSTAAAVEAAKGLYLARKSISPISIPFPPASFSIETREVLFPRISELAERHRVELLNGNITPLLLEIFALSSAYSCQENSDLEAIQHQTIRGALDLAFRGFVSFKQVKDTLYGLAPSILRLFRQAEARRIQLESPMARTTSRSQCSIS